MLVPAANVDENGEDEETVKKHGKKYYLRCKKKMIFKKI